MTRIEFLSKLSEEEFFAIGRKLCPESAAVGFDRSRLQQYILDNVPRRRLRKLRQIHEALRKHKLDELIGLARKHGVERYSNKPAATIIALIVEHVDTAKLSQTLMLTWRDWGRQHLKAILASTFAALFIGVIIPAIFWRFPWPNEDVGDVKQSVADINENTRNLPQIIVSLEEELGRKNLIIDSQQRKINDLAGLVVDPPSVSERAKRLALLITPQDPPYARALKAIVERDFDEARRLLKEDRDRSIPPLVRNYRATAQSYIFEGKYDKAVEWLRNASNVAPNNIDVHLDLARCLALSKQLSLSLREYEHLIEQLRNDNSQHVELALALMNRGVVRDELGMFSEAIEDLDEAIAISSSDVKSKETVRIHVTSLTNRSVVNRHIRKFEPALEDLADAIRILQRPPLPHDEVVQYRARAKLTRASIYDDMSRFEDSVRENGSVIHALEAEKSLSAEYEMRELIAAAYNNRGLAYSSLGRLAEAVEDETKAIEIRRSLARHRADPSVQANLAGSLSNRAVVLKELTKNLAALDDANEAVQLYKNLVVYQDIVHFMPRYAAILHNQAMLLHGIGEYELAENQLTTAIVILKRLVESEQRKEFSHDLAAAYHWRGVTYGRLGNVDESDADFSEAIRILAKFVIDGERMDLEEYMLTTQVDRGKMFLSNDTPDRALPLLDVCIDALQAKSSNKTSYQVQNLLAKALLFRGQTYKAMGDSRRAVPDLQSSIDLHRRVLEEQPAFSGELMLATALGCLADIRATSRTPELRDGNAAVAMASEACRLTRLMDIGSIHVLAAASAEADDFESAIKYQQLVIRLAQGDARRLAEDRLKSYRDGKPARN